MLLVLFGLPATGKTFLAKELASELGFVHLNTDNTRKRMLEKPSYSEKEKKMVYDKMFEFVLGYLKRGSDVIIDGTFYRESLRKCARRIARETNNRVFFIEVTAPEEEVKRRMSKRKRRKSESDADFTVYKKIKSEFEPLKEPHLVIDSTMPLRKQVERIRFYLKKELG